MVAYTPVCAEPYGAGCNILSSTSIPLTVRTTNWNEQEVPISRAEIRPTAEPVIAIDPDDGCGQREHQIIASAQFPGEQNQSDEEQRTGAPAEQLDIDREEVEVGID